MCAPGKVNLENLVLKSSAFDVLGLPITVIRGSVGRIELDIPWKSISSSHVVVVVKDVRVVLGPNSSVQGELISTHHFIVGTQTQYLLEPFSEFS